MTNDLMLEKAEECTLITPSVRSLSTTARLTDIPIIEADEHIQSPAITTDGAGNILVVSEIASSILESELAFRYSSDSGRTWLPNDEFVTFNIEGLEQLPRIDYTGSNEFQAYGTYLADPTLNILRLMHFPSMVNPDESWEDDEGWTLYQTDLSGNYEDFKGIDVAGYPHGTNAPTPEFHGTIVWTSTDMESGLETFCIMWETQDNGLSIIYMQDVEGEVYDIAADIDHSTGMFYEALEWKNAPGTINDGIYMDFNQLEADNDGWWEDAWGEMIFEGGANPDVVADGGNCYMVYEVMDQQYGSIDIMCAYSHDNGGSFRTTSITQSPVTTEQFPAVTAIGKKVLCTYTRNGDLYSSISEDGGVTWEEISDPMNSVSGSVAEQYSCASIAGGFVVWADSRGDSSDIYFNSMPTPVITVEISGGFGVTASVENVGTLAAENMPWTIEFEGGIIPVGGGEGTIASLAPGETTTINSGLVLGFGRTTVKVTAGGVMQSSNGFVLGPMVLGL
jgi:hypothetical protein